MVQERRRGRVLPENLAPIITPIFEAMIMSCAYFRIERKLVGLQAAPCLFSEVPTKKKLSTLISGWDGVGLEMCVFSCFFGFGDVYIASHHF